MFMHVQYGDPLAAVTCKDENQNAVRSAMLHSTNSAELLPKSLMMLSE